MKPKKIDVARQLLKKGSLFVHLDPRAPGVKVPPWFTHQAQLVLQVGDNMPIPIHDLKVTEDGVSGTLSFSRTPFWCFMPWSAVFALVGDEGRGMDWPDSMPAEIKAELEAEERRTKKRGVKEVVIRDVLPAKKRGKAKANKEVPFKETVAAGKFPRTKSGKLLPIGWRVIEGGKHDAR